MQAQERLRGVLAGAVVDRPPLCLWHHFRPEGSPEALAAATVGFFGDLGFDLYKVMPDLPYPAPPAPLAGPAAWESLPRLGVGAGQPLAGMAAAVSLVRQRQPEAVILATVFSPLAVALRWTGGPQGFAAAVASAPRSVDRGLGTVAENVAAQCGSCLAAGADGIFFATAGLGDGMFTDEAYRRWGRPFDLLALEGCAAGWCNVLHMHADGGLRFARAADYPVPILSWSDRRTGIPLSEVSAALPGKTVMGGIDERGAVVRGDVAALGAEMRDAVRQTGGRRLIIAGGCSVPDDIPPDHLRSAARLIREWAA